MARDKTSLAWTLGRVYMGIPARIFTRARAYGIERFPREGGVVLALNHLHWIDIPIVGGLSPRNIDFVAKVEAAHFPGVLGLFVEGTRQRTGRPGKAQPGAAMVAIQEEVPVVPAAIYGTQFWKPGNFAPCSIAFGHPIDFGALPKNGRGYKEATAEIEHTIHRLFDWLADVHRQGRPRGATPP